MTALVAAMGGYGQFAAFHNGRPRDGPGYLAVLLGARLTRGGALCRPSCDGRLGEGGEEGRVKGWGMIWDEIGLGEVWGAREGNGRR